MACACMSRRRLLGAGAAGALTLAAGCDDPPIDPVSDATVEAMGLHAWEEM